MDFNKNVFINCPFDVSYTRVFNAIVFAVHDIGFVPRCALEANNAGQFRLDKITDIISECKYSIHDLSHTTLDAITGLPRFNMPFELGLDIGCQRFGNSIQKEKILLVLDTDPHRYELFISDVKGQDVTSRGTSVRDVISAVRDWLRNELDPKLVIIPSGDHISIRYLEFQMALPSICVKLKWNSDKLNFVDFSFAVATWIDENPIG
ncbi:MAG TPA: hypothetical protein VN643_18000 [Pyrinomonadaceae bacterium]|nr:hypothetical protein [Pyrinomonadaceae bacterium]